MSKGVKKSIQSTKENISAKNTGKQKVNELHAENNIMMCIQTEPKALRKAKTRPKYYITLVHSQTQNKVQ